MSLRQGRASEVGESLGNRDRGNRVPSQSAKGFSFDVSTSRLTLTSSFLPFLRDEGGEASLSPLTSRDDEASPDRTES